MDRVLLVEDDDMTRQWIAAALAECPEVVLAHDCGSVGEACAWLGEHDAEIVLTDLGLPDGSGLQVIRAAARDPGREILVLSIFGDEATVLAAIDAGASGYLLKDGSLGSLREHLACLKSRGSPLSPRIARTLIRRTRQPVPDSEPGGGPLSERELEVLAGVGKGFTYAEVGRVLGVSANSVRTHIRRIYEKLAVNSRLEALHESDRRMAEQPPLR